jgi:VWFA-related protein
MQPSAAPRRTLALLLASLAACPAAPNATARQQSPPQQQQQRPRPDESDEIVRVTTELVQTDVTVIDRDGNFVDGLKADQFELKVDGRPRPVLFFERVAAGTRNESAQLAAARGGRAGGASAAGAVPLDRGRVIIVFVDDIHLSAASLLQTRRMLARFIDDELRQNDQMLVAAATGQIGFLQQLTDERSVLRAAVSRLSSQAQEMRDYETPRMSVVQALAIRANDRQVFDAFVDVTVRQNPAYSSMPPQMARQMAERDVQARASNLVAQANGAATRTLQSLLGLIRVSSQFPGRKVLYFISDGFALDQRGEMVDRLRRVTDSALRSGVVVYTLDARGLSAHLTGFSAAEPGTADPTGRLLATTLSEGTEMQTPLRVLAGETGGRAILNTNAPAAAMGRTLKETSVYYLLAWRPEPEDARGERFRRIEVAVRDRPELTVLAQRGFYSSSPEVRAAAANATRETRPDATAAPNVAPDSAPAARPEAARQGGRELLAAFRAPLPRAGVPVTLTLNYAKAADGRVVLNASVQVELEATQPVPGAPPPTDRADLLIAFYDAEGKAFETFQRQVSVTARPGAAVPPAHSVVVNLQSFVKPGLYQVRAASRDPKNGRTGSDVQWIEVPNMTRGNFALSSIFLGGRPPAPAGAAADDGGLLLAPDRRFRRDSKLRFMVHVYNASVGGGGQPDAAIQLQVFRDDQPVVTTPLRKISTEGVTDFSSLPYAAEVSLANLPAGRYTLQLTSIDRVAKASAAQRVKFTVE